MNPISYKGATITKTSYGYKADNVLPYLRVTKTFRTVAQAKRQIDLLREYDKNRTQIRKKIKTLETKITKLVVKSLKLYSKQVSL